MQIEFNSAFGPALLALRQKHRLSKRRLGSLIGISAYTVDAIEKGSCPPVLSYDCFRRLCQVFNVPPEHFSQS